MRQNFRRACRNLNVSLGDSQIELKFRREDEFTGLGVISTGHDFKREYERGPRNVLS